MKYKRNPQKEDYKTKHESTLVIIKILEQTSAYTPDYLYWIEYLKATRN